VREASRRATLATVVHPYCLPVLKAARPRLAFVLDSHNAEYVLKDAVLPHDEVSGQLRSTVRAVEQEAVRTAELITYCTDSDRAQLIALGPTLADWLHVPNGTDVDAIRFTSGTERRQRRQRLLNKIGAGIYRHLTAFVGSAHPPNVDAAYAIAHFAPQLPSVLFLLLGAHAEQLAHDDLPANVLPMGLVPERILFTLLRCSDLALNPMRRGSGSNLKIAQAFAIGVPVITTEVGARGYDVEHDNELLVATISEFPEVIARALHDTVGSDRRAERARRHVERVLDWSSLSERFARGLLAAAGAPL